MAHELAGKPAPASMLIDVPRLLAAYHAETPDAGDPAQRVAFGTSGHRGSSLTRSFNEAHILATTQAICDHRSTAGIDGPLFLGRDTHALSDPAHATALEVLAANGVEVRIARAGGWVPTPVISHAILGHNAGRERGRADGIVVTPSHNPPEDGGFKYNPPDGGPADSTITSAIEKRANELLGQRCAGVKRVTQESALRASTTREHDYVEAYVGDLAAVVDMDAIRDARLRIGVDPLGGAGVGFFGPIAERYGLDLDLVHPDVDPTFSFMRLDWDGKIRMDCSSPYAMTGLVELKDRYAIAFGNDTDFDRHGIVTRSGLMNPNHYLSVAIAYLFAKRSWPKSAAVGKTVVTTSLIDRIAKSLGRSLVETPVGFKWFVPGLLEGRLGFGGEESAGASFLRRDGRVWTTDKDGFILGLLAAEILATTGKDPSEHYATLTRDHGEPFYERIDAPATPEQKRVLGKLAPSAVEASTLADDPIVAKLTEAPGNGASIGGLKVMTDQGWFAARPSGTEAVYKIYAESFRGPDHLRRIQDEARAIVSRLFRNAGIG